MNIKKMQLLIKRYNKLTISSWAISRVVLIVIILKIYQLMNRMEFLIFLDQKMIYNNMNKMRKINHYCNFKRAKMVKYKFPMKKMLTYSLMILLQIQAGSYRHFWKLKNKIIVILLINKIKIIYPIH